MTYSSDSAQTEELLKKVADGNTSALDHLLQLHRPYLSRLISYRMSPELNSRVDPSDIVQETHIVIVKRIKDFLRHRPISFRIWMRRTALEQLVDQRRRHIGAERRSVYREKETMDSSHAIARALFTETPSKVLQRDELQAQIHEVIDGLGETDREILTLRHAEGLSNAEAADLLNIKPDSVRRRYGRALLRLHRQLAANGISMDRVGE